MKKFFSFIKHMCFGEFVLAMFVCAFIGMVCFVIPYSVYKEIHTHYDIIITYINGDEEVIHCDSYHKKSDYLYYDYNGFCRYIDTDYILSYRISPVECDCNSL